MLLLRIPFCVVLCCLIFTQPCVSGRVVPYNTWFNSPDSVEKDDHARTEEPRESTAKPEETTETPSPTDLNPKNQSTPFLNYCETLPNGTEVCKTVCDEGTQIECLNGGLCVLDLNSMPTCSCWFSEEVYYRGPKCEDPVPSSTPQPSPTFPLLVIIVIAVACSIFAILIALNIATYVHFKRKKEMESMGRGVEIEVTYVEDEEQGNRESQGHTNALYFESPAIEYNDREHEYLKSKMES
ncbi:hypothetical protein PoB_001433000 [Plakobranchus ocellatus]|uniref:EGF-like domain-containing protein n=1 Tax=Plakobranchus ocellatus TaxID=259542 RepID=A0AAV3YY54_9GAST|nr:hypothetical protein PoB_001433000 [Plakobranchus ocellatus]